MLSLLELQNLLQDEIKIQPEACKKIAAIFYKYLIRLCGRDFGVYFNAPLITLLFGKTGVGKTHLIKTLSELTSVKFIEINAKSIVQEGWTGHSFLDLLKNQNFSLYPGGILFIDEFDKLCLPLASSSNANVNTHEQYSLLKYLEGMEIEDGKSLKNWLVILGGAFTDLRRDTEKQIGFNSTDQETETLTTLLTNFGMIPEIAGRISEFIELAPLTIEDYRVLLTSTEFHISKYTKLCIKLGLTLEINSDIIHKAYKKELGVRGLIQEVEQCVNDLFIENAHKIDISELDPIKYKGI